MRPVSAASARGNSGVAFTLFSRTAFAVVAALGVISVCATSFFSTAMISHNAKTAVRQNSKTALSVGKIFCFGDSLTAGTSPPNYDLFPYAKHLDEAIKGSGKNAEVRWKGYPGWTSSQLLTDAGFSSFLDAAAAQQQEDEKASFVPPIDLVLILAGTNDMAYSTDSQAIFESIRKIHEVAHSKGCPTVALGIPPSGYQSQQKAAQLLAADINTKLESWASSSIGTKFIPYPVTKFDRDSGMWAPDGLHLSPKGYQTVGESLAPDVVKLIWGDAEENPN